MLAHTCSTSQFDILSKLLERLIVHQLLHFQTSANLLLSLQPGFRPGHSTETAILHIKISPGCWSQWLCSPSRLLNGIWHCRSHNSLPKDCKQALVSTAQLWNGFSHTCSTTPSMIITARHVLRSFTCFSAGLSAAANFIHLVHHRPSDTSYEIRLVTLPPRWQNPNI